MFGVNPKPAALSDAIEAENTRAKRTADQTVRLFEEACRALPAPLKLELLMAEVLASPDVTSELVASYGQRLTRFSWELEREAMR